MDSKSLLARLKQDDDTALKEIFSCSYNSVYQTILRIVNESGTAEDLAQDVFVRFWEKRLVLEIQGEIGPYLRRMAINEGLGYLRKNKKYSIEDIDEQYDISSPMKTDALQEVGELQGAVNKALDNLPPKCRIVFSLSRFEGLSYKEIGEQMNISIKTVENQIGKALKIMRESLKEFITILIFILSSIGGDLFICIIFIRIAMQLFFII